MYQKQGGRVYTAQIKISLLLLSRPRIKQCLRDGAIINPPFLLVISASTQMIPNRYINDYASFNII